MKDKSDNSPVVRKKRGSYSISAVAEMFDIHQQTIRLYERQGLISPSRSSGNTRKFTEEDVAQLEEVIYLTHKLGVNLAGVNMILKLKKKMKRMQADMNKIFSQAEASLDLDEQKQKENLAMNFSKLVQARKKNISDKNFEKKDEYSQDDSDFGDWLDVDDQDDEKDEL